MSTEEAHWVFACQFLLLVVFSPFSLAVSAGAQAMPQGALKGGVDQTGFRWTETDEGSGNTDGFITDIDSNVGYRFGKHFGVDSGVLYLFIQPSTSKTGTTSASGMGNPHLGLRSARSGLLSISA
jgi:hypothetical protein